MKTLSVFIDESGDFAFGKNSSEYYLITLVFHNQEERLNDCVIFLDNKIHSIYDKVSTVHTGPIIRKKDEFADLSLDDRRSLIYALRSFIRKAPFCYHTVIIAKKECKNHDELVSRLSKELNRFAVEHQEFFFSFENIIVYYDNGQQEVKNIINTVFSINFVNVEFRIVKPIDYKLFQVSDYICSFELLDLKQKNGNLSKAEKIFFYKPQELKKQFLNELHKKRLFT